MNPRRPSTYRFAERMVEYVLFTSRWLLAPIYLGLVAGLAVLLVKFVQHAFDLVSHVLLTDDNSTIMGLLALIDLALTGSLVVMVMFAGYENFVSKLDLASHRDKPGWMGHVNFGDLKLKLMASIVAISAIQLLENFMNIDQLSDRKLAWSVGIHMAFVASGVLLAVMDRLGNRASAAEADGSRTPVVRPWHNPATREFRDDPSTEFRRDHDEQRVPG